MYCSSCFQYKFKYEGIHFGRFVRSVGVVDQVSARKFLEAAKSTADSAIFYAVFKFFEQRNQRIKGSSAFGKGE